MPNPATSLQIRREVIEASPITAMGSPTHPLSMAFLIPGESDVVIRHDRASFWRSVAATAMRLADVAESRAAKRKPARVARVSESDFPRPASFGTEGAAR